MKYVKAKQQVCFSLIVMSAFPLLLRRPSTCSRVIKASLDACTCCTFVRMFMCKHLHSSWKTTGVTYIRSRPIYLMHSDINGILLAVTSGISYHLFTMSTLLWISSQFCLHRGLSSSDLTPQDSLRDISFRLCKVFMVQFRGKQSPFNKHSAHVYPQKSFNISLQCIWLHLIHK